MSSATVPDILARWPSRDAVAEDAGVEPIAVYRWEKRGRIPGKHFAALARGAERRGLPVTLNELVGVEAAE